MRSLEGEIPRASRDPRLTREVISSLMRKAPSPVSYSSIASEISVSHRTVREYLELLQALMVIGQAPLLEGGRIVWRRERKFFFLDPFVAKSLSLWTATPYLESAAYEWIVQAHLLRRFNSVHYYRNSYEIDAIAGPLKVEVKVGKSHRRYPKDTIVLDSDDLPLFLALL